MLQKRTDEEIITLYKNTDKEAFKMLINRYTSPIYNFVAHLTNKDDALDIAQEVFIKVWKNINKFEPSKASFKTWIFTIAKNSTTDFLRKKKDILFSEIKKNNINESINSFEDNIIDEVSLPDEALQKLQNSEFLNKTLKRLPQNYQEILLLHYQEEMTFDQIGKILNKQLNTVKSHHRRAILELKKILS